MTKTEQKIQKLLRLAQSSNEHEAGIAFALAAELAIKAGLNLDDISLYETKEAPEKITLDGVKVRHLDTWGKTPVWKLDLAAGIARANRCDSYYRNGRNAGGVWVYGEARDLDIVQNLYGILVHEIDVYAKRVCKGKGHRFSRGFRIGMVSEIVRRLRETTKNALSEAKETAYARGGETALARVTAVELYDKAARNAVQDYKKKLKLGKGTSFSGVCAAAYAAGRVAGAKVNLNRKNQKKLT